jgi:DNA polymerase-3 subunit delta
MLIFLYGDDTYRLYENRDSVIKSYQAKHGSGFNLFKIDGASPSAGDDVAEAVKSVSLFSEVKLVLVNNVFSNSETAKALHELFSKYKIVSDPKIVVLATHSGPVSPAPGARLALEGRQVKSKELLALLADSKNLVRNFTTPQGPQLQAWLKKESFLRGAVFVPGALARFTAVGGADSWARIQNLDKLANYTQSPITITDVDLLIKTETEPNVFEFIDALGSGQTSRAFSLLCGELAFGRDPYYLLTMVMYQFRNMLIVKDMAERNIPATQIASKAGIHPFVVKKMLGAITHVSLADLKRLYQEILDLEQGAKQGKRDLKDGLFSLALA